MYQPRNARHSKVNPAHNCSNWKSNLRERCRRRIKEDRNSLFNSSRNLPSKEELKAYVMETVHDEWKELKESNQLVCSPSKAYPSMDTDEELILKEIEFELLLQEESELREYMMHISQDETEYGKYLEELQEDYIICPLCSNQRLVMNYGINGINHLACGGNCSLSKQLPYGMVEVRKRVDAALSTHSNCPSVPGFTFTKEDNCLYLVCSDCGTIYCVL